MNEKIIEHSLRELPTLEELLTHDKIHPVQLNLMVEDHDNIDEIADFISCID